MTTRGILRARIGAGFTIAACVAPALALENCLPGDTRPTPGRIDLTAEPSGAVLSGVTTADGWQIAFEKLFVVLGDATLVNASHDSCASAAYAGEGYARLLNTTVAAPQKVAEVHALGECRLEFELMWAFSTVLVGQDVSPEDKGLLLLMPAPTPDYRCGLIANDGGTLWPASVYVRGQASRGTATKRFAWAFPVLHTFHDCPRGGGGDAGDAGLASNFTLHGGDAIEVPIVVHVEELFRASSEDGAPLRFDPLAKADTDGDQTITLDELMKAPPPTTADAGEISALCEAGAPTYGQWIAGVLVPGMLRLGDSGPCSTGPDVVR
jgi:hypothetical protein